MTIRSAEVCHLSWRTAFHGLIELLFLCAAVVGAPEGPKGSQDKATAKKPAMGIPCRDCIVAGQPTGKVDCDGCGGTKTSLTESVCSACSGARNAGACSQCQGRGNVACPMKGDDGTGHDGNGRIAVKVGTELKGSTTKRFFPIYERQPCTNCGGRRILDCSRCENGKKPCVPCAGRGSGHFPCEKCKPPGAPRGKPTGKLPCPLCDGRKYVEPPSAPPLPEPQPLPPPLPDEYEGPDLEGQLEGCSDRFGKQEAQLEKLTAQMGAVEGNESKPREGALSKVGDKARELSHSCATRRSDIQKHLGSARDLVVRAVDGADFSRAKQALEECKDRLDDFATDLRRFETAIKGYKEDVAAMVEKEKKKAAARAHQLEIDRAFAAATKQLVRVADGSELPTPKARLVQGNSVNDLSVEVTIVDPDSGAAEDPLPESASASILERLPGLYTEAFRSCPSISLLTVVVTCPRLDALGHDELLEIDAYKARRAEWDKLCTGKFSDDPEKQLTEIREPRYVGRGGASSEWGRIGLISLIAFFFVAVGVLVTARVMTR